MYVFWVWRQMYDFWYNINCISSLLNIFRSKTLNNFFKALTVSAPGGSFMPNCQSVRRYHNMISAILPSTKSIGKENYIKQYSAISRTTALAVPSRSSRTWISSGSTASTSPVSVRLLPDNFCLNINALNIHTTPSITSSAAEWSCKMKINISRKPKNNSQ